MTVGIPETEHAVYDNVGTVHCRICDMTGFDHMKNPLHEQSLRLWLICEDSLERFARDLRGELRLGNEDAPGLTLV